MEIAVCILYPEKLKIQEGGSILMKQKIQKIYSAIQQCLISVWHNIEVCLSKVPWYFTDVAEHFPWGCVLLLKLNPSVAR